MACPAGESRKPQLRVDFDRRLKLKYHGGKIISDGVWALTLPQGSPGSIHSCRASICQGIGRMAIRDSYLFPTLEAGSSRVFNVCLRTAQLSRSRTNGADAAETDFLFLTRELNNVIFVKEARPSRKSSRYHYDQPIGTKLYFPYNCGRIYDGGKSVFIDDPQIRRILNHHAGLDIDDNSEDADRDLNLIRLLEELPSLEPFLVKDKLDIEGISANEVYFQISESEWKAIQTHVSEKLQPIISFAFPDSKDREKGRTRFLMKKLWNTKDIDALMPIMDAFNLPREEAGKIFSAWKGIMYYDFEYNRSLPNWRKNIAWMQQDAVPTDFVDREQRELLRELMDSVRGQYKEFWQDLQDIFSSYEEAYDKLFVLRQEPGPFIEFMRDAVKTYWILGSRMSAINHSAIVWDILTSGTFKRRIGYDQLYNLFEMQREIFNSCR